MKIKNIQINNFRSLKDVHLDNISNLTILIGGNSSGKSNLLDALFLFFNEFDPAPERNLGTVSDYIWFNRDYKKPIKFKVTVTLSKEELTKLLPEIITLLTVNENNELSVTREIKGTPSAASWLTKDVIVNDTEIIKEGKLVLKEKKGKQIEAPIPPQQPSVPLTQYIGTIFTNISNLFKGQFKVVYATRNYIGNPARFGERVSFIQPAMISELTTLGSSLDKQQQDKWTEVEKQVTNISANIQDIRVIASQVAVTETKSAEKFPISLIGGGNQEIVTLIYQLTKEEGIFGLEEPEIHLNPKLARQLFGVLKDLSNEKQMFIATHSTVFVDNADLNNTWVVRREDKETKVVRIEERDELKNIVYELGIKPSDIFFSNSIIFVEGLTEKVFFPILAEKIGASFKWNGLAVIPINGKASGRYRLHVWTDAAKDAQIPFFMILDKVAEKETKELKEVLKPNKNLFILKKIAIEDYYPESRLIDALKSAYGLEISEEDETKILETPRDKNIERYLREKDKSTDGWKIIIGEKVAQSTAIDEIDDELKHIIERISTELNIG